MNTVRWAQRLQAIAQTGLAYPATPFDVERYTAIREIAAEMLASQSADSAERILELFDRDVGHATPKVDVRGAVFQEDRILLVRERSDGLWTLPGGWADVGESPSDAVVREVFEESGYRTHVTKLAMLHDRNRHGHPPMVHHVYKLFFVCSLLGGTPTTSHETSDVAFFPADAIPALSLNRVVPAQIERLFVHQALPDLPSDFD